MTKLATLMAAIAQRLDVRSGMEEELEQIKQDVAPEAVLDELEAASPNGGPEDVSRH